MRRFPCWKNLKQKKNLSFNLVGATPHSVNIGFHGGRVLQRFLRGLALTIVGPGVFFGSYSAFASDLETTMRAALVHSASLAAARQNWIAVREDIGTNSATRDWKATGTITGTHARTDAATVSGGYKDAQTAVGTISLSKNLYDGGQQTEGVKLDQLLLDKETATYEGREQTVLLAAIEAHLAVIKAKRDVELNLINVERLESHVNAAQIRVDAGAATPTRLAEAEARLARGRSSLIVAQTALSNAEDSFRVLTGTDPAALEVPPALTNLPQTVIEAEEFARKSHPDVLAARAGELAAEQSFSTLTASVRPSLAFSLNASDTNAEGEGSDKTVLSAQLTMSTPLMITSATRAKTRNLSAKLAAARYARDDALRSSGLQARETFRNLETARGQLAAVMAEVEASRLVAVGIRNEFEFGQKTSLDVQDAEQDVNDAEIRLVTAHHGVLTAGYRLQAALGRLTSSAMGLDDVIGTLQSEPAPTARLGKILPFVGND